MLICQISRSVGGHVDLTYMPINLQPKPVSSSRDQNRFLSSPTPSLLLAVGGSWWRMWQGWEVVFGPDTFRGQTVTLCQPGGTPGTAMLNTSSWSANGKELVLVSRGMCLFVCLSVCVSALARHKHGRTHTVNTVHWLCCAQMTLEEKENRPTA